MAFPEQSLGAQVEFQIGGVWTDVTQHALTRGIITHTRGLRGEGSAVDPATCEITLKSPNGLYSPRNPRSPYFGLIGRNTPMRMSVRAGANALYVPGSSAAFASTPDAAALDIVGDLDVRVDATLSNWNDYAAATLDTIQFVGKFGAAGGTKSWFAGIRADNLYIEWSADGTATLSASSTVPLPISASGRMALRVTLDVDNGAAGRTITFYTAASGTSGPWTQLGDPVVQAGTTSIFNSATALRVGRATDFAFTQPIGRFHKAEVRSGIAGTVVANPDFSVPTVGVTSFADAAGLTWSIASPAAISNKRIRFQGEFSDWPARWGKNGSLITVEGEGAGILRRLNQGQKALASTLSRRIPSYSPLAYWPAEEGEAATQAYSPITGVAPLRLTNVDWAQEDSLPSSDPLPVLASTSSSLPMMIGRVPASAATLTEWGVQWLYRLDQGNASERTFLRILSTGTVSEWYILQSVAGVTVFGRDRDGATVFTQGLSPSASIFGQWNKVEFNAVQDGANVDWHIGWVRLGNDVEAFDGTFVGTIGRPTAVASPPDGFSSDLDGMAIGHISVWADDDSQAFDNAISAWTGETAGARMQRLADEESLPVTVCGVVSGTALMGPQRPATLLEQLEQCEAADGGLLIEDRQRLGLRYRSRTTLYSQSPVITLPYNSPALSDLEPVDDDAAVRNDRTVQRTGGSSGRAELTTGALSVQPPPDGVGRYDDSVDVNVYSDDQTEPMANWLLHLGTWDEARYPTITLRLHKDPSLIPAVLDLVEGDMIRITDLPDWLPPGPVDLLVQGQAEQVGIYTWQVDLVCAPAGPWTVAALDDTARGKVDTDGSQLAAAVADSATSLPVLTTAGIPWTTDGAQMPVVVRAGGEVMPASAITSWLKDTFTRTVASGWGTPDTGVAWTNVGGGSASDYATNGSVALHTLSTVDTTRRSGVTAVHPDFELLCDVTTSALATGDSLYGAVCTRMLDANNLYMTRAEFTTSNTIVVTVRKMVAGVQTQLGSSFTVPATHVAGTFIRLRFQGQGSTLRARAWLASGREPSVWHIETTDSAITAASQIGTRSVRVTGNTNLATVAVQYDNFEVINPQTFTVTRSLTKAHTAGTDLRLATPSIVAL